MASLPTPAPFHPDPEVRRALEIIWRWAKDVETGTALSTKLVRASTEDNLLVIRGRVDTSGSGTIVAGSGFSITRNGAGDVTVNFTSAFGSAPSCQATAKTNVVSQANVDPSTTAARFVCFVSTTGAAADNIFDFLAIGPSA